MHSAYLTRVISLNFKIYLCAASFLLLFFSSRFFRLKRNFTGTFSDQRAFQARFTMPKESTWRPERQAFVSLDRVYDGIVEKIVRKGVALVNIGLPKQMARVMDGKLEIGDRVRVRVDGIGRNRKYILARPATPPPAMSSKSANCSPRSSPATSRPTSSRSAPRTRVVTEVKETLPLTGYCIDMRAARQSKPTRASRTELSAIVPRACVPGVITAIRSFGAFVDIGAVRDGLISLASLRSHRYGPDFHSTRPSDIVCQNDIVRVQVSHVNVEKQRISLDLVEVLNDDTATRAMVNFPVRPRRQHSGPRKSSTQRSDPLRRDSRSQSPSTAASPPLNVGSDKKSWQKYLVPPVKMEWKVGDACLAFWQPDARFYPATVIQKPSRKIEGLVAKFDDPAYTRAVMLKLSQVLPPQHKITDDIRRSALAAHCIEMERRNESRAVRAAAAKARKKKAAKAKPRRISGMSSR